MNTFKLLEEREGSKAKYLICVKDETVTKFRFRDNMTKQEYIKKNIHVLDIENSDVSYIITIYDKDIDIDCIKNRFLPDYDN